MLIFHRNGPVRDFGGRERPATERQLKLIAELTEDRHCDDLRQWSAMTVGEADELIREMLDRQKRAGI